MAKKNKRQTRKVSPTEARPAASGASMTKSSGLFEREFNPDYSQTIKDLNRIGVLAGSFFTLLIVLSFFLR